MIGPLAAWELRRLVRRGLALRVWLLLLYCLVLVFFVFAALWFYPRPVWELFSALTHISSHEADVFADRFTLVLLEAQLAALVAITPALAASAVSEEKDRQTLPLLLTTQLTDHEIVFGKAAGRIVFILAMMTAGIPVLLLALFFGKVDIRFLIAGYWLTLSSIMLCTAIGVNAACEASDFRAAILRAYGRTAVLVCGAFVPPLFIVSPFGLLSFLREQSHDVVWLITLGCGYPLLQVLAGVLFLTRAARVLRLRDSSAGPPLTSAFPLPPRPADPPFLQAEEEPPPPLPPLDARNPVLWKERCMNWRPNWTMPSVAKVTVVVVSSASVLLFMFGSFILMDRARRALEAARGGEALQSGASDGGLLLTVAGVFAAGRYILPLVIGLSGSIAGERFRRTLDLLLSTPLDRRTILRAKMQTYAERGSVFAGIAVAAIGMAFTADGGIRVGVSAAVLVLGGIMLVIGLGAWQTVRCSTDLRAFRRVIPLALLAVGWPVGAWHLLHNETEVSTELLARAMLIAAGASAVVGVIFWALAEEKLMQGE